MFTEEGLKDSAEIVTVSISGYVSVYDILTFSSEGE
jgi:hypothetical protein